MKFTYMYLCGQAANNVLLMHDCNHTHEKLQIASNELSESTMSTTTSTTSTTSITESNINIKTMVIDW